MSENTIILLSKNPGKIAAANSTFNKYGITVEGTDLELPEIQADTSAEVAKQMALEAYKILKAPLIREDHSFFLGNTGIPGPYMAYFDKRIDADKLRVLLQAFSVNEGHFELAAAFVDKNGELHEFSYQVPVVFEMNPRGDEAQNWERFMRFPDNAKVFAEYPSSERSAIWSKNYAQAAQLIADQASH